MPSHYTETSIQVFIMKSVYGTSSKVYFWLDGTVPAAKGVPHSFQSCPEDPWTSVGSEPPGSPLLWRTAILGLLSLWQFVFLLSAFKGGLRLCLSQASVFPVPRFAPSVSHHGFWLGPLTGNGRFILSGLNYIVPSWLLVLLHSE